MSTRETQVAKVIAGAPVSTHGTLRRAFEGKGSRANAIRAMCLACTGFDRKTIRNCTGWSCPLWPWRPFQSSSGNALKTGVSKG